MPEIKLKYVCSVSTEDPKHPADNLLSQESYRKWQCGVPGEKQAVVIIEFEKASFINSIDIGNNGSAFIEVLVGKSTSEKYEVLLAASSFMSPAESKGWNNINRVRIFGKEKLSKSVAEQRWDRVKLVCTQPFNKNEKHGISFIKFHSPPLPVGGDNEEEATPITDQPKKIGIFGLKADPTASTSASTNTLLFKRDPIGSTGSKTMAAKARQASTELLKSLEKKEEKEDSTDTSSTLLSTNRKKPAPATSKAPPTKTPKVDQEEVTQPDDSPILFNELLKGVVFSLSGFQNPLRGNLRDKALEMGAEYEPDWGPHCTHLICAFASTPKYNLVKSRDGIIVTKQWLIDSYDKKKRQQAKRYRFSTDSSEGEKYDKKEKQIFSKIKYTKQSAKEEEKPTSTSTDTADSLAPPTKKTTPTSEKTTPIGKELTPTLEDDPYGGSTDEGSDMETEPVSKKEREEKEEECDTEDEIERVKREETKQQPMSQSNDLLNLPDFFSNYSFFLYGDFSSSDSRLIKRYITAYNGSIHNYMNDTVTHVVTQQEWDHNFDQALEDNSSLIFLQPGWIFECHSKQSCVPYDSFTITQQDIT